MIRTALLTFLFLTCSAQAHEQWANGAAVPPWVKTACCGPKDVHTLDPSELHELRGGAYKIDGIDNPVPPERVFDSLDGTIWAFYSPAIPSSIYVHCLFVARGS